MEAPPPIVHTLLPLYALRLSVGLLTTLIGLVMGIYVAVTGISGGSPILGVLLGAAACGAFVGGGLAYEHSIRKRTIPREDDVPAQDDCEFPFAPELRHVAIRLIELPWMERQTDCQRAWQEFTEGCHRLGLARPRTIVHSGLATRLGALERPGHGMEPEPILGSGDGPVTTTVLWVTFFLAFGAIQLSMGHWFGGSMMLFVAGIFAFSSIPSLRDRFRIMRWDDGNLVAGMGGVKDVGSDRLWSVNDAVMLVRTKQPVGALFVRFVGEAGILRLTFVNERDPDFVKMWQRWNHPRPKPELMHS